MKPAKRLKKSLAELDKVEELVKYNVNGTTHQFEYYKYLRDIREELTNLSLQSKEHDIRLAKKIMQGNIFKRMSLWNRFKFALRWVLTGEV